MLKFSGNLNVIVSKMVSTLEQSHGKKTKILSNRVKRCLYNLKYDNFRHGEVRADNDEQIELIAHYINKHFNSYLLNGSNPPSIDSNGSNLLFKLGSKLSNIMNSSVLSEETTETLFIGASAATAYFLDTMNAQDSSKATVIGMKSPWAEERGLAIPFINHTDLQTSFPSENYTQFGGNSEFTERKKFANLVYEKIKKLCKKFIQGNVTLVENTELLDIDVPKSKKWRITYKKKDSNILSFIYTDRVYFMAGAGEPRTLDSIKQLNEELLRLKDINKEHKFNFPLVLHMDQFVRDCVPILLHHKKTVLDVPARGAPTGNYLLNRKKQLNEIKDKDSMPTVAIIGSNAAIDAAAAARARGWNLELWLSGGSLAYLEGTPYKDEPYNINGVRYHKYKNRENIVFKYDEINKKIHIKDDSCNLDLGAFDSIVYGLGSNDKFDNIVKTLEPLKPFLDTSGAVVDPSGFKDDEKPEINYNGFLCWADSDLSLFVFGLAAENYEKYVIPGDESKKSVRLTSANSPNIKAMLSWLSGDVLTTGQLTYFRSAISIFNNYIPSSIGSDIDFSHANVNTLAGHLIRKYPNIPSEARTAFITGIHKFISLNRNNMPHGFYPMQINCIKTELSILNILYNKKNNINEYAWVEILNNLFVSKLKVQIRGESLSRSYA